MGAQSGWMDVSEGCAGRTEPVYRREVESGVPTCGENMLGLCGEEDVALGERKDEDVIAEGDVLWLYQGTVLDVGR